MTAIATDQVRRRTRQSGGLALLGAVRADSVVFGDRWHWRYLRQREACIRAGGR